jgi:catechol 2,3-dioxygenase-like lactoylglutathione lyase family enzyme
MATMGLSHVNLRADRELLDQLKDFYCDVIGLKVGMRPPFPGFGYWLYSGDQAIMHLHITRTDEERLPNIVSTIDHIAFVCTNRKEVEAHLKQHSLEYQTVLVPVANQVQLFVRDPAGNRVELNFANAEDR